MLNSESKYTFNFNSDCLFFMLYLFYSSKRGRRMFSVHAGNISRKLDSRIICLCFVC